MKADRVALAALLAALALWGLVFVERTSFFLEGGRHFVLFDDAMISMAYARNVAAGEGPVWTPGSRPVEGFTTPLWTALMVPVHALPLPPRHLPLVVQLVSLVLLGLTVWRVRALLVAHFPGAGRGPWGWLPAGVLTAFHYSLAYWSLMGMETALQALLAVLAVHLAYDVVFAGRDRHLALFAVFAAAYLTRMDMTLLVVLVAGWVAVHGGFRRSAAPRWLAGAAMLAAVAGGYQLFRQLTFGAPLPNTYYLKLASVPLGLRLARGLVKAAGMLRENALPAVAVAAAVATGVRWRRRTGDEARTPSRVLLPGLLVGAYLAYGVWVGGDAWELPEVNVRVNRFLAPVLPLALVAVNDLINRLATRAGAPRAVRRGLAPAATVALLLLGNGLVVSSLRAENWGKVLLVERPPFVGSHAHVLSRLRRLEQLVAPGARVVTVWAGIPAYFSRYELIDAAGYNDPVAARRPPAANLSWRHWVPGHDKVDATDLLARRPDAFFQGWMLDALPVPEPRRHVDEELGYQAVEEFWLRRDSPYLLPGALDPPPLRSDTMETKPMF